MTETPTQKKPNRRAVEAAATGALGAALLAGLGTTFAKWYEEASIGESSLQSGHLNMSVSEAQWVDVNNGEAVISPESFRMVPGDKVRYTANVTPDLEGDNLSASLRVDTSGIATGDLTNYVEITTAVGTDGAPEMNVTPQNTAPIRVSVEVEFPLTDGGADPATDKSNWWGDRGKDSTLNLSGIKIELDQNDNP